MIKVEIKVSAKRLKRFIKKFGLMDRYEEIDKGFTLEHAIKCMTEITYKCDVFDTDRIVGYYMDDIFMYTTWGSYDYDEVYAALTELIEDSVL